MVAVTEQVPADVTARDEPVIVQPDAVPGVATYDTDPPVEPPVVVNASADP
jgi:hypothetical protein